jgi:hypothetical protein
MFAVHCYHWKFKFSCFVFQVISVVAFTKRGFVMLKLICSAVLCVCLLSINVTDASAQCFNGTCKLPGRPVARVVNAVRAVQPVQKLKKVAAFVRPVQRIRGIIAVRPFQRVRGAVRSLICR